MPLSRFHRPALTSPFAAMLAIGVLCSACKGDAPAVRADSSTTLTFDPPDATGVAPSSNGWNGAAGPLLLVAGPAANEAIVFIGASGDGVRSPLDTGAVDQGAAVLFGRDSTRFTATLELPAGNDNAACRIWPLRNLRATQGGGTWSVGFVNGSVAAIPLDSVDALSTRDSTALVAEASRLASAVTATTSPAFQGLRFSAHDIRRFQAASGVQAIAARLTRRLNQEDDPQEEETLLIAERDSGVVAGPYQLAYAERTNGKEEEVSTSEIVAGVRIGSSGQPSLVVARDGEEGLAYALLERSGSRRWKVRWTSERAKCAD